MYDEWGNEIGVAEPAYPVPDGHLAMDLGTERTISRDEALWDAEPFPASTPGDLFTLADTEDAFVLPSAEGAGPVAPKPGSVDDWLTPLSNNGEADLGEIVVPGVRPPTGGGGGSDDDNWTPSHDSDNRDNEGGGGSWQPDDEQCSDPPNGPTPAGVHITDLRVIAREAASLINTLWDRWEWGSIIYTLNGQIHATYPVTQQNNGSIVFNYSNSNYIPDGAHIVAWVHSHPHIPFEPDQDALSTDDTNAREEMLSNSGGRFTVDNFLMSYVIDNEHDELLEFGEDDDENDSGDDVTPCSGL